ncbi:hypothetical protein RND81_04G241500 [Saponaria officinalis]|uniref:Secreted protein n=1 Tax=Saponaria officinalis TaxID=3572 RepID=A0AAW1LPC3_SAPOF
MVADLLLLLGLGLDRHFDGALNSKGEWLRNIIFNQPQSMHSHTSPRPTRCAKKKLIAANWKIKATRQSRVTHQATRQFKLPLPRRGAHIFWLRESASLSPLFLSSSVLILEGAERGRGLKKQAKVL